MKYNNKNNLNISSFFKNQRYVFLIYFPLFISAINIISNFFEKIVYGNRMPFADFSIYRCAAITFSEKISPYFPNALSECLNSYPHALDFFYPPITLNFFSLFAKITEINSVIIWAIIILPIFCLKIFLSHKLFMKKENILIFIMIYLFSFGGLNYTGLLTGNISILFYTFLGISLYHLIINNNAKYFFIVLTLMCLFKITYLSYFFLLFFLEKKNFYKYSLISLLTIFIIYIFSYHSNQDLFLEFFNQLKYIRSDKFFELYGGGFGMYSILNELPNIFISNINNHYFIQIAWFTICFVFLCATFFLFLNNKNLSKLQTSVIGILVITVCYPVLKDYEGLLLIPCIYYLLFNLNLKNVFLSKDNLIRYSIIFLTFAIHDKYMLFFISILLFFYINYLNFKKIKIFK